VEIRDRHALDVPSLMLARASDRKPFRVRTSDRRCRWRSYRRGLSAGVEERRFLADMRLRRPKGTDIAFPLSIFLGLEGEFAQLGHEVTRAVRPVAVWNLVQGDAQLAQVQQ